MHRSFTIHTVGGRYKADTPIEAAKKAAAKLFKDTKSKSLTFCIRETTKDSRKKLYHYKATRTAKGDIQVSVNKNKKVISAYKGGGVGGDVRTIIQRLSESLKLIDLFNIFYDNFDNLQILFDNIKINDFDLRSRKSEDISEDISEEFEIVSEQKVCIRAVFFSYGSYIMYRKFGGFFSNMFLFMYFLVKYFKENNRDRDIIVDGYIPDKNCILYLLNFMPLNYLSMRNKSEKDLSGYLNDYESVKIGWFKMTLELNNTIQDHIFTGFSNVPHFFMSSATTIPDPYYLGRTENFIRISNDVIENLLPNNNDYKKPMPILIYFKSSELNQCVDTKYEDDHVFAPYIPKEYIMKIDDKYGKELSDKYLDEYFGHQPSPKRTTTTQKLNALGNAIATRVNKLCTRLSCSGDIKDVYQPT
jgi:hypothetical protein